jgi:DNA invertase Pin-like site-specific DNA recombinase
LHCRAYIGPGFPPAWRRRAEPLLRHLLITNNHVIEYATRIEVGLSNGRRMIARLIGTDIGSDVAVIKVDEPNLPSIKLGDSDAVRVGVELGTCWRIGYARVSSQDQNLDRQIAALRAEGCDVIFREKASGKDVRGRPQLEKAIDALPTKGVLVLAEWDRATRSLMDGIHIMERVHKRGAYIRVLDRPGLDLTTPSGRGILALLSGLAEEERTRILRRANEGRIAAIKRGTKLGRKPKLDDHQQREAIARLKAGESCRKVARSYRVHHSTVARLMA